MIHYNSDYVSLYTHVMYGISYLLLTSPDWFDGPCDLLLKALVWHHKHTALWTRQFSLMYIYG